MSENFRRATLMVLPVAGAGLGLFGATDLATGLHRPILAVASAPSDAAPECQARHGDPGWAGAAARQRADPGAPSQSPAWWQQAQAAAERCLRDRRAPRSG